MKTLAWQAIVFFVIAVLVSAVIVVVQINFKHSLFSRSG